MKQPKIAVATYVWNAQGTQILMSERLAGKMKGFWNLAGGHLEWMEQPLYGAEREVKEETGLNLRRLEPLCFDYGESREENHCWVVLFFCGVISSHHNPENTEPDKNGPWTWVYPDGHVPEKLLAPAKRNLVKAKAWADAWRCKKCNNIIDVDLGTNPILCSDCFNGR
jgi:ADP-ribose pyrophosphatase YjhB (NUDIX family)